MTDPAPPADSARPAGSPSEGADDAGWDADALGVLLASFTGTEAPEWLAEPLAAGLAGVILFGYNTPDPATCARLARSVHALAPDALVTIDEEGGDVSRLQAAGGSVLPTAWALGTADDPVLTRRVGRALGEVLAACDVDLDLAPVLDVSTDPRNPVIGTRAFGDDPHLVSRHARALADGLREAGMGSCGKHFPGHGATHVDSHTALPVVDLPAQELRRDHLAPWEQAPALDAVMTAHVLVPALGEGPASIAPWSRALLDDLCGPGGYDGLVVTDALDMAAVAAEPGFAEAAVRSVEAGAHLLCLGTSIRRDEQEMLREAHDALVSAVACGRLSRRVLRRRAEATSARIRALRERRRAAAVPDLGVALDALEEVGREAASRVVRAHGARLGAGPVTVIDTRVRHDHASGTRRSVLVEILRARGVEATEATGVEGVQEAPESGTVLILTRLPGADPAEGRLLDAVLAARPDAIVVHVGLPAAAPPVDRLVLALGHGRAMLDAAVDALLADAAR